MTNPSLSNSHIHILGIAGTMTASLAVALKQAGARVTGSDQPKIFPPISTTLKKADIKINNTDIDHDINKAIIGSSNNLFENTLLIQILLIVYQLYLLFDFLVS